MQAAVYYGPREIKVEEVPDPQISAPHEMLVKVRASSSDI
jgi:alcohol dehydrogenase